MTSITKRLVVFVTILFMGFAYLHSIGCTISMPGKSYQGVLPPLSEEERRLSAQLRKDVYTLAEEIGERNIFHPEKLQATEKFLTDSLEASRYKVERQVYLVQSVECSNLSVELRGTKCPEEIVIVGAHYDAVHGSPAANDNASGTAATLSLAQMFAGKNQERTIRFVFFTNEEPPFFWTDDMGSLRYARESRRRKEKIVAMFSLETIGFYSDEPGSQHYPPLFSYFYPSVGNFIAFVGMSNARDLISKTVEIFRRTTSFPSEGAALPWLVPRVGSSDHWSFWKQGYPALMVTDTAPYRYPYYHTESDTPEKIDYERMARVVGGLEKVVEELSRCSLKKD